ncbi:MAG: hypothetical protein IJP38_05865 [Oscillospiraceae bacterium]|nr:hypothetical protein [Oscillospiraceae bacterium]
MKVHKRRVLVFVFLGLIVVGFFVLGEQEFVQPFQMLVYPMQIAGDNSFCCIDVKENGEISVSAGEQYINDNYQIVNNIDSIFWRGKLSQYKISKIKELLARLETCEEHNEIDMLIEGRASDHFTLLFNKKEYRTIVWFEKAEPGAEYMTDSNYIIQMLGYELCEVIPFNGRDSEWWKWYSQNMIGARDDFERVYKPFLGEWDVSVWKTNIGHEFIVEQFSESERVERPIENTCAKDAI